MQAPVKTKLDVQKILTPHHLDCILIALLERVVKMEKRSEATFSSVDKLGLWFFVYQKKLKKQF